MSDISVYLNHGKTRQELDEISFSRIGKKWFEFELRLFSVKWFDYRFLHPAESTMIYMEEFGKAYRRVFAETIDFRTADSIRVPCARDLISGKAKDANAILGCWRGRQVADALGMPYEVYINLAMENRLRFWRQSRLPRPTQLYSEAIVEKMADLWKQKQEARLYVGAHQNYRNHRYCGYEWQNQHHEWLFEQAGFRSNPGEFLARFIEEDILPEEKVRSRMAAEDFETVRSYLN